jgi:hypothetical protein
MTSPYNLAPLKTPGFFHRLFGHMPKENSLIELNNLLAESKSIQDITVEDVYKIAENYKTNLLKKYRKELEMFYEDYLKHCLIDKSLSDQEVSDLNHLKHILDLQDNIIDKIHSNVIENIYKETVEEAINDGRLDPAEREFLEKLERELKLDAEIVNKIYSEVTSEYIHQYIQNIIQDQRLSDDEEKELESIAKSLGVNLTYDENTKQLLDQIRLYWLIENGEIPSVEPGINLQSGEKCYCIRDVEWFEHRTVTKRIRYSGPTYRLKIIKGLSWRIGDLGFQKITDDILAHIDSGRIYLTNKRLLFLGARKNTSINLSKILDFTPYKNGVDIQKDSGKSPFLKFEYGIEMFSMMLGRAISDLS